MKPVVEAVIQAIQASPPPPKVKEILTTIPLSERQIQKRFKKATGLTVKQFLTIQQFRTTTEDLFRRPGRIRGNRVETWVL